MKRLITGALIVGVLTMGGLSASAAGPGHHSGQNKAQNCTTTNYTSTNCINDGTCQNGNHGTDCPNGQLPVLDGTGSQYGHHLGQGSHMRNCR